jgi:hypothetical protein
MPPVSPPVARFAPFSVIELNGQMVVVEKTHGTVLLDSSAIF